MAREVNPRNVLTNKRASFGHQSETSDHLEMRVKITFFHG